MQSRPTESQINTLIAGYVLQQLGYQIASETVIPRILRQIGPQGGTAFRDALIAGCNLLVKLAGLLKETGTADNWNIVHVILTDGDDAGSKTNLQTTVNLIAMIGKLLHVKTLKIVLIGVGVSAKAEAEMRAIARAGGQNTEYYSASQADIGTIFTRITVTLGLQQRRQVVGVVNNQRAAFMVRDEISPFLAVNVQNYAVLFNLDVSGSMAGTKWNNVCDSVDRFVSYLGENDLVAAMVFNHEVKLLAKMSPNDSLFKKRVVEPSSPRNVVVVVQRYEKPVGKQPSKCYCQVM